MKDFDKEIELYRASSIVERTQEWRKWIEEIPYISFPAEWEVKIIPPFNRAIVRFIAKHKQTGRECSVYLDCYDELGCFGSPYWEVYPHDKDVFRCPMDDIESLLKAIGESITKEG